MEIYIIMYDNGEPYEDFWQWLSDKAYINKEDCTNALLDEGYIESKEGKYVLPIDDYSSYYAEIISLNLC